MGPNGLYEKNVTIAIARKLKTLLDADAMFKPVLTRDGDYFISVMGRSDVARKRAPACWSPFTPMPRPIAAPAGISMGALQPARKQRNGKLAGAA